MFICTSCNQSSPPNEKLHREVAETKPYRHPQREYRNKRGQTIHDSGNEFATQIVRERNVCRGCKLGTVDKLIEKFNAPIDEERPAKLHQAHAVLA